MIYSYLKINKSIEKAVILLNDDKIVSAFQIHYNNLMNQSVLSDDDDDDESQKRVYYRIMNPNLTTEIQASISDSTVLINISIENNAKYLQSSQFAGFNSLQEIITLPDKPNELKESIASSLYQSNYKGCQAVIIPIFDDNIINILTKNNVRKVLKAIILFVISTRNILKLKTIKISIDETSQEKKELLELFIQEIKRIEKNGYICAKAYSIMDNIKALIEQKKNMNKKIKSLKFEIVSDKIDKIGRAKDEINSYIQKEKVNEFFTDSAIKELQKEQIDEITRKCADVNVAVVFDFELGQIKLNGINDLVNNAKKLFSDLMITYKENRLALAQKFVKDVRWDYSVDEKIWIPFNVYQNVEIENAYNKGIKSKLILDEFDEECLINFDSRILNKSGNKSKVRRIDTNSILGIQMPGSWKENSLFDLVLITKDNEEDEYDKVMKELNRGITFNGVVQSIYRVQNKTLFIQYQALKNDFQENRRMKNFERKLFHGTNSDAVTNIWTTGFNRSYAGKNATGKKRASI